MKTIFICILVIVIALGFDFKPLQACNPDYYFLFREEAQTRLDSLSQAPSDGNLFERVVLMHNLGFHKNKDMRKQAEKLFKKNFKDSLDIPLYLAYSGSLQMIKVSHRSKGGNIFKAINPLNGSPYDEAREGFKKISDALKMDTANYNIRILRAAAAAESANHLDELFDSARVDLNWLENNLPDKDSISNFLINLNWAILYFRLADKEEQTELLTTAMSFAELAHQYACTEVYRRWSSDWITRITEKSQKMRK